MRVGVLLEGTEPGVAERAEQMSELLASAGGSGEVTIGEAPPSWWGTLPADGVPPRGGLGPPPQAARPAGSSPRAGTVVRVSFWVSALGDVLEAVMATGAAPAVTGSAGAGVLYACLDPSAGHDRAAGFVTALRGRLAGPRGSVAVLTAPEPVLVALGPAGRYGQVPGLALMQAVKDQFDPGHRMFPGRL
jgi:glycolate oxidase FAD binding subunit